MLSTLDIKKQEKLYILATILCFLFAMIYENFSHGVISYFMVFAFLIPLTLGVILNHIIKDRRLPTKIENNIYNAGVATLTFGAIIEGVLEIYGTTNIKIYIYLIIGISMLILAMGLYFLEKNIKFK